MNRARSTMKALVVQSTDDGTRMTLADRPLPKPDPEELRVQIEATALNRADLLQKRGLYPPPEGASSLLGLEMAGRVVATGAGVTRFRVGDAVFGLLDGGGYAEYCTIDQGRAMPVPDSLSFTEAAAVAETFLTAWQGLRWLGELRNGEQVLIHAGASGVGTAAIQLATAGIGAKVAVTAGSDEKLELCKRLGAKHLINYRSQPFANALKKATGNHPPDLILDVVGGSYWDENLDLLAPEGRLVLLGLLGGVHPEKGTLLPILKKRLTIRGSTLRNRPADYKRRLVDNFSRVCFPMLERRSIAPVIDSVFDWNDVEKAHRKMEENRTLGKVVLSGMKRL